MAPFKTTSFKWNDSFVTRNIEVNLINCWNFNIRRSNCKQHQLEGFGCDDMNLIFLELGKASLVIRLKPT
ncbi:hypothetical protein D3OALGA1CA_1853 [Olavius algarvensis associated proteobacterium Delta 3]|nr:hypothetical protein D3OALGA1CA_1853 [Olavius algarvensis associated proteobacterium Delta 3]CAB5135599.1 hypothetical protein D3OALGB2SA_3910 [Olavius algarvensis associated proteobacterium Delta 3]